METDRPGRAAGPRRGAAGCRADGSHAAGESGAPGGGLVLAEPVTILDGVAGSSAVLETAGTHLITHQAQWEAGGFADACPGPMDFGAHDVIIVAMGEQPNAGYWVRIDAVQQAGDELAVQCTMNTPAEGRAHAAVITYPFHAVVVPKTGAALAVLDPTVVRGEHR